MYQPGCVMVQRMYLPGEKDLAPYDDLWPCMSVTQGLTHSRWRHRAEVEGSGEWHTYETPFQSTTITGHERFENEKLLKGE